MPGVALTNSQTLPFGLGEWVLVTAAAGGIGMSAVQIAKGTVGYLASRPSRIAELMLTVVSGLGAKVIAAAGTQDKLDAVKKYAGADYLIDYTRPGWQKEVLKITEGHGVDVVYDPVGLIQGVLVRCLLPEGGGLSSLADRFTQMHSLEGKGSRCGFRRW